MALRDEAEGWTQGALITVTVKGTGNVFVRPAAFVWALQDGIEWVEPSYADPWGAATPAWHVRKGTLAGYTVDSATELVEALPFEPELDGEERGAKPLLWFTGYLQKQGTTWEEERARVRALLDATEG